MSCVEGYFSEECPICMDNIEMNKNCITTECGHRFHCSCLMKNAATNGFGCPYCRSVMAEEPDSDDESDDESDEEEMRAEAYSLASMRWMFQRLTGEEMDEIEEEESEEEEDLEEEVVKPSAQFIAQKLQEQGVTLEDMVKCMLLEHEEYINRRDEEILERASDEMFGKFRIIISNFVAT
jgi:hypothetical protein